MASIIYFLSKIVVTRWASWLAIAAQWACNQMFCFLFFVFFLFSFTSLSSFYTHIETNQSVGGAKTGVPGEKPPDTPASRTSDVHFESAPNCLFSTWDLRVGLASILHLFLIIAFFTVLSYILTYHM